MGADIATFPEMWNIGYKMLDGDEKTDDLPKNSIIICDTY